MVKSSFFHFFQIFFTFLLCNLKKTFSIIKNDTISTAQQVPCSSTYPQTWRPTSPFRILPFPTNLIYQKFTIYYNEIIFKKL